MGLYDGLSKETLLLVTALLLKGLYQLAVKTVVRLKSTDQLPASGNDQSIWICSQRLTLENWSPILGTMWPMTDEEQKKTFVV